MSMIPFEKTKMCACVCVCVCVCGERERERLREVLCVCLEQCGIVDFYENYFCDLIFLNEHVFLK